MILRADARAQKPVIDTNTFKNWATVGGGLISDDGRYVCYTISNQIKPSELVIQSVEGNWKVSYRDASLASFTHDSKRIVFMMGKDSLCLLTLGASDAEYIAHVRTFQIPETPGGDWLAFRLLDKGDQLILRDIDRGTQVCLQGVTDYLFGPGAELLITSTLDKKGHPFGSLEIYNLSSGNSKVICKDLSGIPIGYAFNNNSNSLVFATETPKENSLRYRLYYFKKGMDSVKVLVDNKTLGINRNFELAGIKPEFTGDGHHVIFGLKRAAAPKKESPGTGVNMQIWSYMDRNLEPVEEEESKHDPIYSAVIDMGSRKIIRLTQKDERVVKVAGKWALVRTDIGSYSFCESNWNRAAQPSFYIVDVDNGSRICLRNHIKNLSEGPDLSPTGKWAVYYDFKRKNYFSYNNETCAIRNITFASHTTWVRDDGDYPEPSLPASLSEATWLSNDRAVLISDNHDIWKIDPSAKKAPLNLTNGYGQRHNIHFSLLFAGNEFPLNQQAQVVLRAIDEKNQDRGFYSIQLDEKMDPKLLSMGQFVYGDWEGHGNPEPPIVKSQNGNYYLVKRMSATEAPNYFVSNDLRHFRKISDRQPQQVYNWLTTELLHWKTLDGRYSSGILYKPENFDSSKKYPLILNYYEIRSDELNLFITPAPFSGSLNIPWFVSRGYLIFVPDIHYKIGEPGQSAYNSIVSAASFLSKKPFVDGRRLAIQGHSFGGYETNYVVTHTGLFAAACSASGVSDLVSLYGSIARGSYPMYWAERNQGRMGSTPWNARNNYIANSPIFRANDVVTPLLVMHNKGDIAVPFSQSVEFFTSLRRLGKKVWMLQYDDGGHSINGRSAEDFTIRMTQFFDYYLKGAPAPDWMTGTPLN